MSTTTPRLRSDLRTEPVEDAQGVLYFDVSDPKSGGVLRLFDFEWLLAQKFDGQRGFDEVARLAEKELGLAANSDDIKVYAERLSQLGLFDGVASQPGRLPGALMATAYLQAAGLVPRVEVVPSTGKPAPTTTPVVATTAKPIEKAAPPVTPSKPAEVAAPKATPAVEPLKKPTEPVAPAKPIEPTPAIAAKPIEPVRRTPARDDDDRMGQPVLTLRPPTRTSTEASASKPLLSEPPVKPAPPVKVAPAVEAAVPAAPRANLLEALESLPPPVESEAVAGPAKIELPASVTDSPGSLLEEVMAATKPEPAPAVEAKKTPVVPIEVELPAKPVEAPKPVEIAKPVEAPKPVEVAKPAEVPKPVEAAKPVEPPKPLSVAKAVETAKTTEPPKAAPPVENKGGGGKWVAIILLLLVIGGAVFWFVVRPMMMPQKVSVKTTTAVVADISRNFSAPATVKPGASSVLKLAGAGKVTMVVEEGKAVAAGTALVELDTLAAAQKAQTDAQKALDLLKKKLETGRLKGKAAVDLQAKITEKQNKLGELETQSKLARLVAEKEGTVAKVLVKLNQTVTVGTEAVSVVQKGLIAELKVPTVDSGTLSEGQQVNLTNATKSVSLKGSVKSIAKQDGTSVVTMDLPGDTTVKAGDELLVEKTVLKQVVSLPTVALQEGGRVLVVKDGKAAAVAVTVSEQDADSVVVKGLLGGEQVIQTRSPDVREGVEVEVSAATR